MTTSEPATETDVLRDFTAALTASARHHLSSVSSYDSIRCIRAACERHTPAELAKIVGRGISWHTPANAPGLILFRLRREAGLDNDDDQEMTD